MVEVYGIKNCNTVKKAIDWLTVNNIPFNFHDFKKEPVTLEKLKTWEQSVSWEALVNKKGTTWRKLSPEEQALVIDADSANKVLFQNNSMIKRPVIESNNGLLIGFDEDKYSQTLLT